MKKSASSQNYRLGRAHELVFKNRVAFDSDLGVYHVKSISDPTLFHFVVPEGKKLSCDCLGFMYNKQTCSHCVAVRIFQRSGKK